MPIILLAESTKRDDNSLEIIDGMQRFDSQSFPLSQINTLCFHDLYCDLNTIAITKALLDSGKLQQHEPIMSRDQCVGIASYLMPLSIYEFADEGAVDTVFRADQFWGPTVVETGVEVRTGSVGHFATVVRRVSAKGARRRFLIPMYSA